MTKSILAVLFSAFAFLASVSASGAARASGLSAADIEPLIGDWSTGPENGAPVFVQSYHWDAKKSYVWVKTSILGGDGVEERVHFEGIAIWNARDSWFDYLFAVEPGSQTQERGTIARSADGTLMRTVQFTGGSGAIAEFRQVFEPLADGRIRTRLQRKTEAGWEPTFPGSDALVMVRRR